MEAFRKIALALTIIGALNWGLVSLFDFDAVATLAGGRDTIMARIIYGIVAIAGLVSLSYLFRDEPERHHRIERDDYEWQTRPPAGMMEEK
ncbi:hypothetical protein AV656_15400 [Bhargavaea cecembensis]|uniref:DUF378 domain-containing protein n=1 Tax=Bhargavaea cecembensis TaxID=394098 RepID=A0A165GIL1_9BACL|nr:DUF378 domain-containing protein [Bhargavaea cecembensis]KZE36519.1 hypothetical protein AV656_15400 [Bhargavaea cecembensis]